MPFNLPIFITFGLLAMSIGATWATPCQDFQIRRNLPWLLIFLLALMSGMYAGYLTIPALLELVSLIVVASFFFLPAQGKLKRAICASLVVLLSLALALHLLPGFHNPLLISNYKFSIDAAPYTQYANFDKGAVGLILLVYACDRSRSLKEFRKVLVPTIGLALCTSAVILASARLLGFTRLDIKFPSYTAIFLVTNLFFTVVAEETFFRGLLQTQLARILTPRRFGEAVAISVSALLFGLAHFAGGTTYMLLSCLLGFGCAYSFYATGRKIEAPILLHFLFNTIHFIGFTYPRLL